MPKKDKIIDEAEIKVTATEEQEEQEEQVASQEENVTTETAKEVHISTNEKMAEIRTLEEINCVVGQKRYVFAGDTLHKVPADVCAILCNAKKAIKL